MVLGGQVKAPKYILVSRKALTEQPDAIADTLKIIALQGALVACPGDAELAHKIVEGVLGFNGPFALVADFDAPLAVINDDGSVEPMEVSVIEPQPVPLLVEP